MNNDEKIIALKEKISRGDYNLSGEERTIISLAPSLWIDFTNAIKNNNFYNNPYDINQIIEIILLNFDSNVFNEDDKKALINEYVRTYIQSGYYDSDLPSTLLASLGIEDDEYAEELTRIMNEEIANPKNDYYKENADNDLIIALLDAKRYDVLETIRMDFSKIGNDVIQRMIDECPKKGSWRDLKEYQLKNCIYEFDINDSFETLVDGFEALASKKELSEKESNLKDQIREIAREKIEQTDDLSDVPEHVISSMFSSFDSKETIFAYRHLTDAKKVFEKNGISLAPILFRFNAITKEDITQKIELMMQQNKYIPTSAFDALGQNLYDNERYVDYLIKQGEVSYLMDESRIRGCEDKFKECIPKIVNEINNNNPNYDSMLSSLRFDVSAYPEIAKAIIRQGKMELIYLNYFGDTDDILEEVVSLAKRKNVSVNIDGSITTGPKLACMLLENDCIDTVCDSNLTLWTLDERELVLSKLDNVYFAGKLLEECGVILPDEPEIMNKILTNPLLTDKVIEYINHHEDLVDKVYTDETFYVIEDYLVNKYNVNKDHLEKMQKRLGNKIIMYIDNENLQSILALDDEEFDKILGLFPDVEYTMTDVEASYESLIQHSYGKENVEDIAIFATMNHAIEDNDLEKIKNIRKKLVIGTKKDFLEKLLLKHNIENIRNTGQLIDLIIKKSCTDEKIKYIDILHELTDEYIANSRIEYRNNHYFDEQYPEYANLLDKFLLEIDRDDSTKLSEMIYSISKSLDKSFYKVFEKGRFIPEELKNPETLLYYLIGKIRNGETRDDYLPVLKEIIDYHHDKNRDENSRNITIGEELSLDYSFEEKSKKNAVVKYIILNNRYFVNDKGYFLSERIEEELLKLGFTKELIVDCTRFYGGHKYGIADIELVQEKLNTFVKVCNKIIRTENITEFGGIPIDEDDIAKKMDATYPIKKIYKVQKNSSTPYRILCNLNIEQIRDNLLSDEEMYDKLVDIMKKKKLHLIPDNFEEMIEKTGISSDLSNIAAFINFFPSILEGEQKKLSAVGKDPKDALTGLTSILINADTYSSVSSVYSQILGDKDAKLIKANSGPNEARLKIRNNERLNEAIEYTAKNFTRTEVTIPTFDEMITIDSSKGPKKIEAIVGNFTDGSNLTHGERTGACMRIGGVGETLFRFCLTNKNGFHIRFENPETHEYISRVSGFRNGNTVFLNELRYSCNHAEYSDSDVVEACTEVARRLIEKSKDSSCPIENVVITKEYAMRYSDKDYTYLGIVDNKKGLPKFYSDIGTSGIVLATTATDKPFVPIDLDNSNVPSYETCRSGIRMSSDPNELLGKINRVASIKTLLSGVPPEEIDSMEFPDGILCGIYSDDWYIYVDEKKEIHYDVINVDKRAEKEVAEHLELVDNLIKQTEKDNEMKGDAEYGTK
jgi:hypothetical protein